MVKALHPRWCFTISNLRQARELGNPLVGFGNLRDMILAIALDDYGGFWQTMADTELS